MVHLLQPRLLSWAVAFQQESVPVPAACKDLNLSGKEQEAWLETGMGEGATRLQYVFHLLLTMDLLLPNLTKPV